MNILNKILVFIMSISVTIGGMFTDGNTSQNDTTPNVEVSVETTVVPTATSTPVPSATSTPVPTATSTPVPTATSTPVPTATSTPVPTATSTPVPTATNTPVPTATSTPVPTATSTPVPTATNTPVPTATSTPVPTATSTPVPTATSTPVPTATNTPVPTATNTPVPTVIPTFYSENIGTYNVASDFFTFISNNYDADQVIFVEGYKKANDGGSGFFMIAKTADDTTVSFKLNNGLYANYMVTEDTFNMKAVQYAIDNMNKTLDVFRIAIKSGAKTIYIANGEYDLNNTAMVLSSNLEFVGESQDGTVLKNVNISATHGISLSYLTIDGGTQRTVSEKALYLGKTVTKKVTGTIMIVTTPAGQTEVSYSNCTFRNADYCSVAIQIVHSNNYFTKDTVEDCLFENITFDAIHHAVDCLEGVYKNNTFYNIGSIDALSGHISGVQLGDTSNHTDMRYAHVIISNNTFDQIHAANDYRGIGDSDYSFYLKCTAIDVHSDYALISNNKITNLIGYGIGRFAIYSKSGLAIIDNNYIENIDADGGYITRKSGISSIEKLYTEITNNTIIGVTGLGIKMYTSGKIEGNSIQISNCKNAIMVDEAGNGDTELIIKNNIINCAMVSNVVNGTVCEGYKHGSLINVLTSPKYLEISGNDIKLVSNEASTSASIILISKTNENLVVDNNVIDSPANVTYKCITVRGKNNVASNATIDITNNIIYGLKAVSIIFSEADSVVSNRIGQITNNLIINNTTTTKFASKKNIVEWTSPEGFNNDQLTFEAAENQVNYSSKWVYANLDTYTSSDESVFYSKTVK